MDTHRRSSADIWDWPLNNDDGMVMVVNDRRKFEADLEVPSFRANEIDVKVMKDELVVHCSSEPGSGRLPREIHRCYKLPPDVDLKTIKSTVGSDGKLRIIASKLAWL